MARPNWWAGLAGLAGGLAQGLESNRDYNMRAQQLAIMKAAAGIRDGTVPTGASLTPDASAAAAPALPASLDDGSADTSLPSMAPPNPIATNSSLLSPAPPATGIGPSGGGSAPSSGGLNGMGLPTAPGGIGATATPPSALTPPNLTGGRSGMLGILSAAAANTGSGGAPDSGDTLRNHPELQALHTALHGPDATAATGADGVPTTQGGVLQALRAANDATPAPVPPATGNNFAPRGNAGAALAAAAALMPPGASSGVSDANVANARGAINGQIAFHNPTVRNPLTGQMEPRYQDIGRGMFQDILSDDFSQKARLEQLGTDRALSMWGIRGQNVLDRTNLQQTGANERNANTVTGANDRNANTVSARSADVLNRIDAQEQVAHDNRAAGMQKFLTARTPTDQQRAQLTLGTYDKLRLQAKDPITGEYSVDPDTLWSQAQSMVSKALPSARTTASASAGPAQQPPGGQPTGGQQTSGRPTLSSSQQSAVAAENAKATKALQSIDPNDPQAAAKHSAIANMLAQRIGQVVGVGGTQ